ncbi:putative transcriptional regulator YebC [Gammaproteobacteria bacterium]
MAGHSKWANIQHRKGVQDAKRGKLFTKLIREITVSARHGGGDPAGNPRLRLAIDKALFQNMTKDTIERAVKRGSGTMDTDNYEEIRYEGYGPGGVAVMVDCMTDNRVRTVADVRHAFSKCGGNLGTNGSVNYLFTKIGLISFAPGTNEDHLMAIAIDTGANDVVTHPDHSIDVFTNPEDLATVKQKMTMAGFQAEIAEVMMHAATKIILTDVENAKRMIRLQEMLDDLDDVQQVYSNADIPDAILARLG